MNKKRSEVEMEIAKIPQVYIPHRMERVWKKASFLLDVHKCNPCYLENEVHLSIHLEREGLPVSGELPALFFSLSELMNLYWENRIYTS